MAQTKIYGVTAFINDCNFTLKKREKQVITRMSYQAFFTKKSEAMKAYLIQSNKFKQEQRLVFGKYEPRGRCEVYIATVMDNSQLAEHGTTILKEEI